MSLPVWLSHYASATHSWHKTTSNGRTLYYRRQGFVEGLFDSDGTDFEGRADIGMQIQAEIRTSLSPEQLRERILLAWAILRQRHVLMSSRAVSARGLEDVEPGERVFVFEPARGFEEALREGRSHAVFVEDFYPEVDREEFYDHLMNTKRCVDAEKALSKLFVMPIPQESEGSFRLDLIVVLAHQITDGLTTFRWTSSFVDLLNLSHDELIAYARRLCSEDSTPRLPPTQESLYPRPNGNLARQRWYWLLTRILRHTRRPPPASFQNPLRRETPLRTAERLPPKYSAVLDYSTVPPLNGHVVNAHLGKSSVHRLTRLCRQAGISLGSGGFVIVALVMMKFEEQRRPGIPLDQRLPFVGSFPVNPRPFLAGTPTTGKEDSLMLAFSEGITLPFLPSDLDFEGRFKLLGRLAHRQLREYQKRKRTAKDELQLGSKSSKFLISTLFLSTLERLENKLRPEEKRDWNVQGEYPTAVGSTLATCGVSSVGDRTNLVSPGKYDVSQLTQGRDLVADFRSSGSAVRPRDGEFLVGSSGDKDSLDFTVSYDGCAIDPDDAQAWKAAIESILEPSVQQPIARFIKL